MYTSLLLLGMAAWHLALGFTLGYLYSCIKKHSSYSAIKKEGHKPFTTSMGVIPDLSASPPPSDMESARIISPQKRAKQALNEFEPTE